MVEKAKGPRIAAILAAGGIGSRFSTPGTQTPKQCLLLAGRPLYMWCLLPLCTHDAISDVVVVANPSVQATIAQEIYEYLVEGDVKVSCSDIAVIAGGETRQDSVFEGLKHLSSPENRPDYVIIHDAARPFLTRALLHRTILTVPELVPVRQPSPYQTRSRE